MSFNENFNLIGFSDLTQEKILHYVYCLVDPRDNKIFYVGKGKGNRVFDHAKAALSNVEESDKLNLIREINNTKDSGGVQYYILRHGLTDSQAIEIEATLIDLLTSSLLKQPPKMTVQKKGDHTSLRGIKSIDDLEVQYSSGPFVLQNGDYPIFLNIHQSYSSSSDSDIYSAARSAWEISQDNIKKITHILVVYHNVICAVFIPENWKKTEDGKRWEFDGIIDNNSPYKTKSVKDIISFNPKGIGYYKINNKI